MILIQRHNYPDTRVCKHDYEERALVHWTPTRTHEVCILLVESLTVTRYILLHGGILSRMLSTLYEQISIPQVPHVNLAYQ